MEELVQIQKSPVPLYDTAFPYSARTTGAFDPHHRNERASFGFCDGRALMMDTTAAHERKLYFWKPSKRDDDPK